MCPIHPDLDMFPTGKFTIHTHPTLHDTTILCTPDGREFATLNAPRIRHLFRLLRPDLVTQHSFEEEVYHLITRLDSCSEIHSPTPTTTTVGVDLQLKISFANAEWGTSEGIPYKDRCIIVLVI
jgi:hypothetical protein